MIPQLGVSYSIENKLGRQSNPPLNSAWDNKAYCEKVKNFDVDDKKNTKQTNQLHVKTRSLPARVKRPSGTYNVLFWNDLVSACSLGFKIKLKSYHWELIKCIATLWIGTAELLYTHKNISIICYFFKITGSTCPADPMYCSFQTVPDLNQRVTKSRF